MLRQIKVDGRDGLGRHSHRGHPHTTPSVSTFPPPLLPNFLPRAAPRIWKFFIPVQLLLARLCADPFCLFLGVEQSRSLGMLGRRLRTKLSQLAQGPQRSIPPSMVLSPARGADLPPRGVGNLPKQELRSTEVTERDSKEKEKLPCNCRGALYRARFEDHTQYIHCSLACLGLLTLKKFHSQPVLLEVPYAALC